MFQLHYGLNLEIVVDINQDDLSGKQSRRYDH